ncbi:UNVERIFIED_ORG: hypothetical protein J2Y76_005183 [Pseudomonas reinekei]|uniref:TniQ family protein n=1 Tax=Pseudomonas laurylsulfatiphila TaxID=2011015 RepID=UPI003D1AD387|nr:hypothetical protein [Pseudomonas reinekei]
MLQRIQPDESLRSYVARNLFVNRKDPTVNGLRGISILGICSEGIKKIASVLQWPGCHGFNRLLHHHTAYPLKSVLKSPRDISYSQTTYISARHWYELNSELSSFCPECVREDLRTLGFSYWRRSFQDDVTVCPKHNLLLLNKCPFCEKSFSDGGHGLEVMWSKCGGAHLGEAVGIPNKDPVALKRARFVESLCSLAFHIPDDAAICILYEKLLSIEPRTAALKCERERKLEWLRDALKEIDQADDNSDSRRLNVNAREIFETLVMTYESIEDFVTDFLIYGDDLRSIDSLWSTYNAGGFESVNYIEESYTHGVGIWSCPFPSPLSLDAWSNDVMANERPVKYHCCNYSQPQTVVRRWAPRSSRMVGPAMPRIPIGERVFS